MVNLYVVLRGAKMNFSKNNFSKRDSDVLSSKDKNIKIENTTILLIEDYPSTLEALFDLFNSEGFNVLCAHNSKEAIHKIQFNKIDIVLCKCKLNLEDGITLCKKIKKLKNKIICYLLVNFGDNTPQYLIQESGIQSILQLSSNIEKMICKVHNVEYH